MAFKFTGIKYPRLPWGTMLDL